jgi:hypothetical protein
MLTTISNSTKYVGAIVGPDDEARAKQFQKKLKQINYTLDSLKHMQNPTAEFQMLMQRKACISGLIVGSHFGKVEDWKR